MELTKAEKKWIADVNALLKACPSERLGFFTIGDRDVTVYDFTKEKAISKLMDEKDNLDYPGAVEKLGAEVGSLHFPNLVHSVAG